DAAMHSYLATSVTLAFRMIGRVGMGGVAHRSPSELLPLQPEPRLVCRPIDHERQAQRFAAMRRIKRVDLDVVVRECVPASLQLCQNAGSVPDVKHRHPEHFPVRIAWMRVIRVFDGHRPAVAEAILHLAADLLVRQVGQKGKSALRDSHMMMLQYRVRPRPSWWARSPACRCSRS